MPEQTLEHWPTERMILEGHADYATPGDLEELDDTLLADIAEICDVDQFAPDECIPCLAHTMILERRKAAEAVAEADGDAWVDDGGFGSDEEEVTPKLDNLLRAVPPWTESDTPKIGLDLEEIPVAEQFAIKVAELSLLVEELMEGPPIPPPGVTLEDLALLTLAADKWVKMSEIQGGLAPQQQQMLDATRELVARLRS